MIKVKKIINNDKWKLKEDDEIILDHLERNRRRIRLQTKKIHNSQVTGKASLPD